MSFVKVLSLALVALATVRLGAGGLLGGGHGGGFGGGYGGGGYSGGGGFGGGGFGGGFGGGPAIPYNFQYAVRDAYSGNDFGQHESGDGAGNVKGEYQVRLPDGRNQLVTYTASDATGYVANVQYQGTPHYPSGPVGGGYRGGAGGGFGGGYGGGAGGAFGGGLSGTYLPPHGK